MPKFDKKLCLNNIYYLAKERNIKIGDLESKAEISTGYFSRLNKDDNKTSPSIDVLCSVADDLKISLDSLISVDFSTLTEDETLIIKFIDTLKRNLNSRKDHWEQEKLHVVMHHDDYKIPFKHPLLSEKKETYFSSNLKTVYNSFFYPEATTHLIDDIFYLEISYLKTLFLSRIGAVGNDKNPEEVTGYEIYITKGEEIFPVCCAYEKWSPTLYDILKGLYNSIKESTSRTVISKDVRQTLDSYINTNSSDDPPF